MTYIVYDFSVFRPRKLKIAGIDLANVFTLRTIDDMMNLVNTLGSNKDMHVVISGSSFIGQFKLK